MTTLSSKLVFVGLFVYFSYELSSALLKYQRQGPLKPHLYDNALTFLRALLYSEFKILEQK